VLTSCDHRPSSKEERDRISRETNGRGRIVVGRGGEGTLRVVPAEGDFPIEEVRRKKLGLATSRSLGHVILSKYGVSSQPEFFTADLEDGDKLVLGILLTHYRYMQHNTPLTT